MYETVRCRRALSPSGLPGMDYALNPYGGCEHGCVYCYAPEVTHSEWASWRVVRVRVNVVERLAAELPGVSGTIGLGTSTDPYQGAERRFLLTRRCLETLRDRGFRAHVITKSDLVLRDVRLLGDMDCVVGVTVTGLDERTSKAVEPGAPMPSARLAALKALVDAGIDCYAMVEPVLDRLEGREAELCEAIAATGVRTAEVGRLNLRPGLSSRLGRMGIGESRRAESEVRRLLSGAGVRVLDPFGPRRGAG